ncbi:MAG TPA: hypothetical protein VFH51_08390 [Myxococcota bacterium]|nr:hypothetical protein [Myxococcota bacterium]
MALRSTPPLPLTRTLVAATPTAVATTPSLTQPPPEPTLHLPAPLAPHYKAMGLRCNTTVCEVPRGCDTFLEGEARLQDSSQCHHKVPLLCLDIAPCEWHKKVRSFCNGYNQGHCVAYSHETSTIYNREYIQPEYNACHLLWTQARAFCNDQPIPANEVPDAAGRLSLPIKWVLLTLAVGFAGRAL